MDGKHIQCGTLSQFDNADVVPRPSVAVETARCMRGTGATSASWEHPAACGPHAEVVMNSCLYSSSRVVALACLVHTIGVLNVEGSYSHRHGEATAIWPAHQSAGDEFRDASFMWYGGGRYVRLFR